MALSVQVLQEFYHQATRSTRPGRLTHADALAFLGTLLRFPIQAVTLDVFRAGVAISQRFGLSYWDGAILAAARALGCDAVYSEGLSSEQDYDGLRVINPFNRLGGFTMPTDTSERGLERLICTALAGHPCEPPATGTGSRTARRLRRRGLERRQLPRLRPRVLRRSGPALGLSAYHPT